MPDRLHKVLAHCGVGSRRECEGLIEQGRVQVNGEVVTRLGTKVDPGTDELRVDGERVKPEEIVYYLVHKPRGYISTSRDEMGRPRVIDLVRDDVHRVYAAGRLDEESEGLLIVTNDGALANVLTHPRYQVDKTYRVTIRGSVTREQVERIGQGVWLAEGKTGPADVLKVEDKGKRTVLTITLWEGRNRELRRILAKVGLYVVRLVRTAIGPLRIRGLPAGAFRRLRPKEMAFARRRLEGGGPVRPRPRRKARRR